MNTDLVSTHFLTINMHNNTCSILYYHARHIIVGYYVQFIFVITTHPVARDYFSACEIYCVSKTKVAYLGPEVQG